MAEEKRKGSGWIQAILSNADTVGALAKLLVPTAAVAVLTGWATWLAGVFQQYAPLSWVVAAFAGGVVAMLLIILAALARMWWSRTTLLKQFYERGDKINPVETVFRNQRIKLEDMMPPALRELHGKTFHDCDLLGPIVLSPVNGHFERCTWVACDHALVRLVTTGKGTMSRSQNSYFLLDCKFINCRFFYVTFLMPEGTFEVMQKNGANWITYTPDDAPPWPTV